MATINGQGMIDVADRLSQIRPIFGNIISTLCVYEILQINFTQKRRKSGRIGPPGKRGHSLDYGSDIDPTGIKRDVVDRMHLARDSIQCLFAVNTLNSGLHDRLQC